jgi:MobA-like NTP transferase domain
MNIEKAVASAGGLGQTLTLVILAAGMGSRYGGLKQVDPMGPAGETVLDYSVYDALRAGFARVVFVIRRDFEAEFHTQIGARFAGRVQVDYVFQALDALPSGREVPTGRTKPWGTGHALWCARAALAGPFAVVNADDFYGADSFLRLAEFLRARRDETGQVAVSQYAMVGFQLANTLSEYGAVSRGLCAVGPSGELASIVECGGILPSEVGAGRKYAADSTVSMNCWGFTPSFLPQLEARWQAFWATEGESERAEFYLPFAVNDLLASRAARVQVLPTVDQWFGVTYREDKPRVQRAINALVARGDYPAPLWG